MRAVFAFNEHVFSEALQDRRGDEVVASSREFLKAIQRIAPWIVSFKGGWRLVLPSISKRSYLDHLKSKIFSGDGLQRFLLSGVCRLTEPDNFTLVFDVVERRFGFTQRWRVK
jgi:hypothetical protein